MKSIKLIIIYYSCAVFFSACADPQLPNSPQENQACEDFSHDQKLCGESQNSLGEQCYYSAELKKCRNTFASPTTRPPRTDHPQGTLPVANNNEIDPLVENPSLNAAQKQRAQNEAEDLLSRRSIIDYCRGINISSNNAQFALYEAVVLMKRAADDEANFCATEYQKLKSLSWIRAPKQQCMDTLIKACMDPKNYGRRFLQSLVKLEKTSESDANYMEELVADLVKKHGPQLEYGVWGVKNISRSYLESPKLILDSPRYNDLERKTLDPHKHSENFVYAWGEAIASAERFVDISSLAVPEGEFMTTLKKSLKILDAKNKEIFVRIIFGANLPAIGLNVDVDQVFRELERQLSPHTKIKLYVGSFASSELFSTLGKKYFSWNHSKIVAIDDKLLLTGGHNLYNVYLDPNNPVHDLSLRLEGDIAEIGHRFCDFLWGYTLKSADSLLPFSIGKYGKMATNQSDKRYSSFTFVNADKKTTKLGNTINTTVPAFDPNSNKVIAVGRLANVFLRSGHHYYNVSDTAKIKMIKDAKTAIYISQQAIYPIILDNDFNKLVIEELSRAMIRGVDVFILKSSTKTEISGGKDAYNSGLDRSDTFKYFYDVAQKLSDKPDDQELSAKLFRHFLLLDTANGKEEVPNHAKLLIVDNKATSVGSHNLYDMSHSEFEAILRAPMILLDYFATYWFSSLSMFLAPQKKAHLSDYKVGEYVLIPRNPATRSAWTLGRVAKAQDKELEVRTDFLIKDDSRLITISNTDQIRRAPLTP